MSLATSAQRYPFDETGNPMMQDPSIIYRSFLAAIERRDVDGVLASMSEDQGHGLRGWRHQPKFLPFFNLWCGHYPLHL